MVFLEFSLMSMFLLLLTGIIVLLHPLYLVGAQFIDHLLLLQLVEAMTIPSSNY